MVVELDKATEARRKALRNGEEDPIVVAQRFLNIYRQMHIFSPERKESFNKMLLDLPPDIRGIFSTLPGGAMLQDYVDDLAEKSGVQKAVHTAPEAHLNEEAHQQAQILATALAKAQSQVGVAAAPAAVAAGPAKLAIDKDFASEFAKIMSNVLQQQSTMQKEGLEKLAVDLSKTQLYIAKSMKESKEEQRQELGELCKTIAEGYKSSREEQRQEFGELYKTIAEGYQASREEQRQELGELCKTIAQSQTALSASLSSASHNAPTAAPAVPLPAYDDSATKKLIEVVLDGQKQINSRLDKVEELSLSKANDNQLLIAAFEKSQAEMIKSLGQLQNTTLPVQADRDDERLARLIGESQENLVKTLLSANFQQNNTNQAQSNNNANNIQINTPDNSAQMLLLIDKIASLQASNEQNLEKAITAAIEAQGHLYDKISRQQTKELAEIIAGSLKEVSRPVYMMPPNAPMPSEPVYQAAPSSQSFVEEEVYRQPAAPSAGLAAEPQISRIPPDLEGEEVNYEAFSEPVDEEVSVEPEVSNVAAENTDEIIEQPVLEELENLEENGAEEPRKKKRKRKKKKKKDLGDETMPLPQEDDFSLSVDDLDIESLPDSGNIVTEEDVSLPTDEPVAEEPVSANSWNDDSLAFEENTTEPEPLPAPQITEASDDIQQNNTEDKTDGWRDSFGDEAETSGSSDDWGFGSGREEENAPAAEKEAAGSNDNQEDQDWEWVYVDENTGDDYPVMEAIGDNSYICSGDLYAQDKVSGSNPIVYGSAPIAINTQPIIFDNADEAEFIDPYQNSILKD